MRPDVTSWKRSASLSTVDLPLPVEPMMAVVLPGSHVKLTSSSTHSAPSEYLKLTFSKAMRAPGSPLAPSSASLALPGSGSAMEGLHSSTSSMR